MKDSCTGQSVGGKAPEARSEQMPRVEETVKVCAPDTKTFIMDKNAVTSEKTLGKEPSKGIRRLLKFGKKNHTSSLLDQSFESDCTSVDGTEHDDNARSNASASQGKIHFCG